jgi:bifunctional lysine-specific demethylase and histidyl-hydroxylase NO66
VSDALTLLSGDAQDFLEKVWASRVHIHHGDPAELVGLLSFDDVDHLLTSTAMRTPQLRLAQDGNVLSSARFTTSATLAGTPLTGLVDGRKVIDLFEGGATVVLQGLHRYWPPLIRLVRDLELALGHPCQANAYLTPPGNRGFAVHSDTHDVFVFQTHGTKQWEVHDADDVREVLLEPGVSMYLPTGTPHAASAQDSVSLHVTLGINQLTWRHVLGKVTGELLRDEAYGEHLPAGYLEDPTTYVDGLADRLHRLADELAAVDARDRVAQESRHFLTSRSSRLRGSLVDRSRLDEIDDATRLTRRPGVPCVLLDEEERLAILLGDRVLRVPSRLAPALEHVRATRELTPADLSPWLDAESRLVLARRLVREGLLQVTG